MMPGTIRIEADVSVSGNGECRGPVRAFDGSNLMHADKFDLGSARGRSKFANDCAVKLGDTNGAAGTIERLLLVRLEEARADAETAGARDAAFDAATQPVTKPDADRPLNVRAEDEDVSLTDVGNAKRIYQRHGRKLRFCAKFNRFIVWSGQRNEVDERGIVDQFAVETVHAMKVAAAQMEDPLFARKLFNHALKSEGNRKVKDAMERLSKLPGVYVSPDELDRDPWLFNCQNGTLDLRTQELRPHRQSDLITKLSPVPYEPEVRCPLFLAFLARVFEGNDNLIGFVRRLLGYTLTGITSERSMFILYGSGANGKSSLLAIVRHVLGDYGIQTPAGALMAKRSEGIPNDIARMKGARFAAAVETDEGRRLAEALIKQLTGGEDMISARFMRAEWFDFKPEFKLFVATNHKPEVRGTDAAIWDRLKLIPFNVRIPEGERDPELLDKLKAEAPGILRWMVAGCAEWRQFGLQAPSEVMAATDGYRAEMDRLGDFIAESCVVGSNCEAQATPLFETYKVWCQLRGEEPMTQTRFGRQLDERGYPAERCKTTWRTVRRGIGIRVFE